MAHFRNTFLIPAALSGLMSIPRVLFAQTALAEQRVILEDSSISISGRLSPDGKWISYDDWSTGNLVVREFSSGQIMNITKGPGDFSVYAGASVFSPDGKRIAFEWNGDEIRVANVTGDSNRLVTIHADLHDWSPDGDNLLVYKDGQLGYVEIKSGAFRSLTTVKDRISEARISPDGKSVAFATLADDPTVYEIRIVSTSTGEQYKFVSGGGSHYAPVWSLDGKSITYLSDREYKPRVWRKLLSDKDPQSAGEAIAEAPDAYVSIIGIDSKDAVYLGTSDRGGQDVYVGKVDWETRTVSEVTMIASPAFKGSRRAVFAPSGNTIAFMQKGRGYVVRPGWQTPVVRDLPTGAERAYPTHLTLRDEPLWATDESALYFVAPSLGSIGEEAGQTWSFYRLDLNTGTYAQIGNAATAGMVRMAGATPGSILYFVNSLTDPNVASIFSLNISSGNNNLLYRIENNTMQDASLSPDRSRLAIAIEEAYGDRSLRVLTIGDTSVSEIATVRPNARAQLMWFSSGDAIITSGRVNGKQGIWKIPVDGGEPASHQDKPVKLDISADNVTEVRLSSDGKKIAFTRTNQLPCQIIALRR